MKKVVTLIVLIGLLFTIESVMVYKAQDTTRVLSHQESKKITFSDFSDGWKDGYVEGYRYVKGKYANVPNPPIAPLPKVNQSSYRDGYNAGFLRGQSDAQE